MIRLMTSLVARDIVQTNELGSDLKNFSTAPGMLLLVAKDRGPIGKPLAATWRPSVPSQPSVAICAVASGRENSVRPVVRSTN